MAAVYRGRSPGRAKVGGAAALWEHVGMKLDAFNTRSDTVPITAHR